MTQIASIDFPNKRIHWHLDTVANGFNPILAYKEYAAAVAASSTYQKYSQMLWAEGNEAKGGSKFTPQRAVLATGVRWVPYDTTHTAVLLAETVNKADGLSDIDLLDLTGLTGVINARVDYEKVEIREVSTGDGVSTEYKGKIDTILSRVSAFIGDATLEGSLTYDSVFKLILAVLTGKVSGAGTGTEVFRDVADSKPRVTVVVDSEGNRSSVTLDGS